MNDQISPKNIIPVVMTIITSITTPILTWHLWHIPDGVSPWGYFSLQMGQTGAGVDWGCLDFITISSEGKNINLIIG